MRVGKGLGPRLGAPPDGPLPRGVAGRLPGPPRFEPSARSGGRDVVGPEEPEELLPAADQFA